MRAGCGATRPRDVGRREKTLYLGVGDAFRHCYWNARMKVRIGHDYTYEIATAHESESRVNDKVMDLRNNKTGRWIADQVSQKLSKRDKESLAMCQNYAEGLKMTMLTDWNCGDEQTKDSPLYPSHKPRHCASQQ